VLFEFARRLFHRGDMPILKTWLHALPAAIALLAIIFYGPAGLAAICRYVLAIPAGLAAAVALARSTRDGGSQRWQLPLAGAAIVFLGVGEAFAVHPLQAFSATALLTAIWSESRRQRPLDRETKATQRWRWPAAFLAIAVAGSTVLAIREQASDPTASVALYAVESGESAAAEPPQPMNIDPRQLARDRAAAQRAKQGLILLAVVAGVAVAWIGLSQLPSVRR
jgi:hypothetical protein